jgi:hypothetical protein
MPMQRVLQSDLFPADKGPTRGHKPRADLILLGFGVSATLQLTIGKRSPVLATEGEPSQWPKTKDTRSRDAIS